MNDLLDLARQTAAELLSRASETLGSSVAEDPSRLRFRPDGKGGELASPLPGRSGLPADALAEAMAYHPLFERCYASGDWIALDLSEQWREAVRLYRPIPDPVAVKLPGPPDFPARIDPINWRLCALLGQADPLVAARLDRGNPAVLLRRCADEAGCQSEALRPDRRLVNECALAYALAYQPGRLAAQLLAIARRYQAGPGEGALVAYALNWGLVSLGVHDFTDRSSSPDEIR